MGSDHEHGPNCSHDHGDNHGSAHSHDDGHGHGHADDHGHHGGEEFVPVSSVHDQFLLLCSAVCGIGLCWMMYFWMTGLPLAAVTEHEGGEIHGTMPEENGGLGKEVEHASGETAAPAGLANPDAGKSETAPSSGVNPTPGEQSTEPSTTTGGAEASH